MNQSQSAFSDHPRHPPLDFLLFGLAHWDDPKWVWFFEGEVGTPACSVTLAHANDERLILVKTAPRERWDRVMAWGEPETAISAGAGEVDFAFALITPLIDMARPVTLAGTGSPTEDRSRYNRGIVALAENQSARWNSWAPARWTLGDRELSARVFQFAHAWTGFIVDDPEYYVGVTAFHVASTNISLAEVTDAAYNFDFSAPFGIEELRDRVESVPNIEPLIRAAALLPDHLLVMAAEPRPGSLPTG
jgi:hypothetical protein